MVAGAQLPFRHFRFLHGPHRLAYAQVLCKPCGSAAALGAAAQLATTMRSALSGPQQNASFADALAELATPLLAEYGGTVKEVDGVMTARAALAAKEMQ